MKWHTSYVSNGQLLYPTIAWKEHEITSRCFVLPSITNPFFIERFTFFLQKCTVLQSDMVLKTWGIRICSIPSTWNQGWFLQLYYLQQRNLSPVYSWISTIKNWSNKSIIQNHLFFLSGDSVRPLYASISYPSCFHYSSRSFTKLKYGRIPSTFLQRILTYA
jgi:hypothetical protein